MELFSTDRERLAFLLETDAALDLDFEALEAQAEAAAEEPSPEQRPKYITNYIGSKQKLVDWIWKHTPEGVESAADAFSGSAVVAYMYKTKGLQVLANDRLEGFRPGGPCLYRRVLVPVRTNRVELPAWLYVAGERWNGSLKELSGGVWP